MSFRSAVVAAAAFLATANAHIIMESPVPFSVDKIDSSPITAQQYPCKIQNGFTVSTMNNMKVGEKQQISFKGSAVHGGGSCQLSVTTDETPTANSVFKVIKSIEGGCPGVDGVSKFDFELPDSIPNGKVTFAWSWFAKLSGGPEMYMNCAPVEVTGGASDDSKFKELPNMLVANIASTTCKSPPNFSLKFPDPGQVVQQANNDLQDPTGDCGAKGNSPPASGASSAPAGQPASSAPAQQPASSAPAGGPSAAPSATNPGGVFAPSASSAAPAQSTQTTLVTVTAAPSAPVQPSGTGSAPQPTSPSAGGGSGTCSQNGAIVCNGATQFGICNNGNVVWQAVAAGTTCSNGTIQKRGYNGRIARPRAVVPGQDFTPEE